MLQRTAPAASGPPAPLAPSECGATSAEFKETEEETVTPEKLKPPPPSSPGSSPGKAAKPKAKSTAKAMEAKAKQKAQVTKGTKAADSDDESS